jgi:hypothetical protein
MRRLGLTNNAEQNVHEMLDAVDLDQNGKVSRSKCAKGRGMKGVRQVGSVGFQA